MNKITFPLKLTMRGEAVANLQAGLLLLLKDSHSLFEPPLILTNIPERGNWQKIISSLEAERKDGHYEKTTQWLITNYQDNHQLEATGAVDKATADALNTTLLKLGLVDSFDDDRKLKIRGRIISDELRGLYDLRVQLLDKNLTKTAQLAEGRSGKGGVYEIILFTAALNKDKPDVQVQVVDDNNNVLGTSKVRYNINSDIAGLDVVIAKDKVAKATEYQQLLGELSTQLGKPSDSELKKRLAELKEDEKQQDITYLANKSGWDARMVAMTALANQFSMQSGIEPEFYYALFRAGVPANENALNQIKSESVKLAWEQAIEKGVVPAELADKIPENLQRLASHSATQILEESDHIGVSSFKDLISNVLDDPDQQLKFAQLYQEQRNNLEGFWENAAIEFPNEVERLRLNSQLGFLTTNNATLINAVHTQHGDLKTPLDLVAKGFYKQEAWEEVLDDSIPVPKEVVGETVEEQRKNYASVMASQLQLSYPTAVVSQKVRSGELPLESPQAVKTEVSQFLDQHQGSFELGIHPIDGYLNKNAIDLEQSAVADLKKLQRVFQISPTDQVMTKLIEENLDSAFAVTRYDKQTFLSTYSDEMGGLEMAELTYAKAHQVHHAVVNVATAYFIDKSAFPLYAIDNLPAIHDVETDVVEAASSVIASANLEDLLGDMDYCACEHCRSWLSPAAYLTDLLLFLDRDDISPPPLDVFLARRPDIQHVQLSCENTNTVLPYIDLVNEILEHYVINGSLASFTGYNIEKGATMEELLANPQFVSDRAYEILAGKAETPGGPLPLLPPTSNLPFHKPLETVRRYYDYFGIPLYEAMERLRTSDTLPRNGGIGEPAYGWEDILMERLRISRAEYAIFTDSSLGSLPQLYGFADASASETELVDRLIATLSNAKTFARILNISYEELIEIIGTQFINPRSHLLPKLEKLGVNFSIIQGVLDGVAAAEEELRASVTFTELDIRHYGGNRDQSDAEQFTQLKRWLQGNTDQILGLIVLSDIPDSDDPCSFDNVRLGYMRADPDPDAITLQPIEFLKLLRFIRLWRKLDWSIEHVDKAISALYPAAHILAPGEDETIAATKLDVGFKSLLMRLAHFQTIIQQLNLSPKRDLTRLLTCWALIDTQGQHSLYRQMFLNATVLESDEVFYEDGYGNYLTDGTAKLIDHAAALRGAFSLSQAEFDALLAERRFDSDTALNVANISAIYRHAYLARALRISVRELIALLHISGLDPFQALDVSQPPNPDDALGSVRPQAIRFIELIQRIDNSSINLAQLLQFLGHVEPENRISASRQELYSLALLLHEDLLRIKHENAVQDDPDGEITAAKMALVYGEESTNTFFGFLNHSLSFSVTYSHVANALSNEVLAVSDRISYDNFKKQLSIKGVMTEAERVAFVGVIGATPEFQIAISELFDKGQVLLTEFSQRYPELEALYTSFVNADPSDSFSDKMEVLINNILPVIRLKLLQLQVYQTLSAKVGADVSLIKAVLDNMPILHAVDVADDPAINDFLGLEAQGLSADIFFSDDVRGSANLHDVSTATINYRVGVTPLPLDPAGSDSVVSGIWQGSLQAPDNGFYNFYINADDGAEIELKLDGEPIELVLSSGKWENQAPVELEAGRLYGFSLIAKKVKDILTLEWERRGMGRVLIPAAQLYPKMAIDRFTTTYFRLLKILDLVESLDLSRTELEHFAGHEDYLIDAESWLNLLPTADSRSDGTSQKLLTNILALIDYRTLKRAFRIEDDSFITLLQNPLRLKEKIDEDEDEKALLNVSTGWQEPDLANLLDHFGLVQTDLTHVGHYLRLFGAFDVLNKLGIGATMLPTHSTNEPNGDSLRAMQAALRARYDQTDWLKVIQPVNDELRTLQRDALVDFVLHQMQQSTATVHIDSSEKLFELFLIDVQMDSCMKTSRIKQAISSAQLFVQRCLLNLEPQVALSSIKAKQWEWMKRYRVWEANRKVFLWPENWLEPELRDNKSPFFKDLESELLQGDITDDSAATALLHYLEKLDEIAKLEICGMYLKENEVGNTADDVVHVIARTSGASRAYYYRRQDGGLTWSPWEKIDLNIEDNPVLPVIWKGRLFLFWLSVLQEGVQDPNAPAEPAGDEPLLVGMDRSQVRSMAGEARVRVTVMLYWSEYYNDKWQPVRTSDIQNPLLIGEFSASGNSAFSRDQIGLSISKGIKDELFVFSSYRGDSSDVPANYFKLYNNHSLPLLVKNGDDFWNSDNAISGWAQIELARTFSEENVPLSVGSLSSSHSVLNKRNFYNVVDPEHLVMMPFEAPFFFQDSQHVFFVTPDHSQVLVGDNLDIGLRPPAISPGEIPPTLTIPEYPGLYENLEFPPEFDTGLVDPRPFDNFAKLHPDIYRTIEMKETIQFGDSQIGPDGRINEVIFIR